MTSSDADNRRVSNLIHELTQTNRALADLIASLWKEQAIPAAIATQLLDQVKASTDRLGQIRPKN